MFVHMVWFEWKEDATPAQIDAAIAGLAGMKGLIPGVLDVQVGKNETARTAHTHGLLVILEKAADLPIYDAHEVHQRVVKELIKPIIKNVNALDFTGTA